jgi:hypothetical protein
LVTLQQRQRRRKKKKVLLDWNHDEDDSVDALDDDEVGVLVVEIQIVNNRAGGLAVVAGTTLARALKTETADFIFCRSTQPNL